MEYEVYREIKVNPTTEEEKKQDTEKEEDLEIEIILPKIPTFRMLKEFGVDRATNDAKIRFVELLHSFAYELVQNSIKYRDIAKRKTLFPEDLEYAIKEMIR